MTPDQWLVALRPYGVKETGLGKYRSRCPGHDGEDLNLAIEITLDEKVLVTCHSHGCSYEEIYKPLFGSSTTSANGSIVTPVKKGILDSDLYTESPETRNGSNPKKGSIDRENPEGAWHYRNAVGQAHFDVYRFKTDDEKGKTYRIKRSVDGAWKRPEGILPVYNLPEVLARDPEQTVLVVEGEKCADSWNKATNGKAELAITWASGAANWKQSDWSWADGRKLHIVADADEPGRKSTLELAKYLLKEHDPISVILTHPEGDTGTDIHDIISAGGMDAARQHLDDKTIQVNIEHEVGLQTVGMDEFLDMPEEEIEWIVQGLLTCGGISLLSAQPKVGKSTLARCLAVAAAQGQTCLGRDVHQGPVLYLAHEEKPSEVQKHFRQLGAKPDDPIWVFVKPSPEDAINKLRLSIKIHRPALVVIDPIFRFLKRIKDGNDYAEMSNAIEPLMTMARKYNVHILLTHHNNKAGGSRGDEVLGSTAIFGGVDCLLSMNCSETGKRIIYSVQRYGDDLEKTILGIGEDGWIQLGMPDQEFKLNCAGNNIVEYLEKCPEPVSVGEVIKNVEGDSGMLKKTLKKLSENQDVKRDGGGKKGDPYLYSLPK